MYSFLNDYSEIAHKRILEMLLASSEEQNIGYGEDKHCMSAIQYIKDAIDNQDADVHLIPGGTQTNLLAISSALRPHECVIAVESGHINVHETGAIESTGHKVVTVAGVEGKLTPDEIEQIVKYHSDEHMVKPKMVYISNSTEIGTVYKKEELVAIRKMCDKYHLYLFLDGARLASALASRHNDLTLIEIGTLVDMFYIGGTKNGAMLGEALVILNPRLKEDFRYIIKQRGALMAKGFIVGIQFEALFMDNLYYDLGTYSNNMATRIEKVLVASGYKFYAAPGTNQLFPIMPNHVLEELKKEFLYSHQMDYDMNHSVIRLVTSFGTKEEAVTALCNFITAHPYDNTL